MKEVIINRRYMKLNRKCYVVNGGKNHPLPSFLSFLLRLYVRYKMCLQALIYVVCEDGDNSIIAI